MCTKSLAGSDPPEAAHSPPVILALEDLEGEAHLICSQEAGRDEH